MELLLRSFACVCVPGLAERDTMQLKLLLTLTDVDVWRGAGFSADSAW